MFLCSWNTVIRLREQTSGATNRHLKLLKTPYYVEFMIESLTWV